MSGSAGNQEESTLPRRTYSPAEAAADAAFYRRLKQMAAVGTVPAVLIAAIPASVWNVWFALAVIIGGCAGIANAVLSACANERLLERRGVAVFVLSSFVRIGLFAIVPVVLALRTPSLWTLGWYFVGFFMPLALFGITALLKERSGSVP